MTTLLDEFKAITAALNEAGIDYAVCGGWAMAIHGLPRATMDIDLLILSDDLDRAWTLAQTLGYDVEGLPLHLGEVEIRRISKLDKDSKALYTLDFLLVTEQLEPIWNGREQRKWPEGRTSVVSREGLIELKRTSGRLQDLADIEALQESDDES